MGRSHLDGSGKALTWWVRGAIQRSKRCTRSCSRTPRVSTGQLSCLMAAFRQSSTCAPVGARRRIGPAHAVTDALPCTARPMSCRDGVRFIATHRPIPLAGPDSDTSMSDSQPSLRPHRLGASGRVPASTSTACECEWPVLGSVESGGDETTGRGACWVRRARESCVSFCPCVSGPRAHHRAHVVTARHACKYSNLCNSNCQKAEKTQRNNARLIKLKRRSDTVSYTMSCPGLRFGVSYTYTMLRMLYPRQLYIKALTTD